MKHSANNKKFYFEIHTDEAELTDLNYRFYFDLIDEKGEILLKSWQFTNKTNCRNGIKTVIRNSKNEDRFEVEQIYDQKWMVRMKTVNSKTIAIIPKEFDTEEEAKNFIEDLKSLTLETPVVDNTKIKN